MSQPTADSGFRVRLADIVSALSMALNLQMGFLIEHAIRVCYLGMKLADFLKLSAEEKIGVYYGALLKDVGCSATSAGLAEMIAGDEIAMKRAMWMSTGSISDVITKLLSHVEPGKPWPARLPKYIDFLTHAPKAVQEGTALRCDRARDIVAKLGLNRHSQEAVYSVAERWDGKGYPQGLRGAFISLPSRILAVSINIELFDAIGGRPAAEKTIRERRGHQLDPAVVDAFFNISTDQFWQEFQRPELRHLIVQMEPENENTWIDQSRLDSIFEAFAGAVDVKSPFTGRHSTGVAMVAERLARQLRLNDDEVSLIRRAGLLHDLGKMSVPNSILDKPGPLNATEWETVRLHPYYTDRILGQVEAFKELALIASAHHERLDGGGYYRKLRVQDLPLSARILAMADVFMSLSEDRPYRSGLETQAILEIMDKEVGEHLDPDVFAALKSML